jgi:hypothetical protein
VSLTSFRQALAAHLATELEVQFLDGYMDQPVQRQEVGCTYPMDKRRDGDQANDEIIRVGVRFFQRHQAPAGRHSGADPDRVDPARLEQVAELVQEAIADVQTGLGPWFCWWESTEFDWETQGIEVIVGARQFNLAV